MCVSVAGVGLCSCSFYVRWLCLLYNPAMDIEHRLVFIQEEF